MANHWAIAIGINQYQFFQPLGCAQADAEAVLDFFVTQAGFSSQQCLLMTDTSPPIGNRSTYPSKENILVLLEDLLANFWQPQDYVWLFFSGYGVNYNGNDYLMPQEGNPAQVLHSGIQVRSLMQSLQFANLNVVLVFDINRTFGAQGNTPVGKETLDLAQELQIATILSCQSEQFSYESNELGHGIFTEALLAALHSGHGSSLTELKNYLSLRTPEFSQHYWRPTQNPVVIIPSKPQQILPYQTQTSDSDEASIFPTEEIFAVAVSAPSLQENSFTDSAQLQQVPLEPLSWKEAPTITSISRSFGGGQATSEDISTLDSLPTTTGRRFIPSPEPYVSQLSPSNTTNFPQKRRRYARLWKQLVLWGVGTTMLLTSIVLICVRNKPGFRFAEILPKASNTANSDINVVKTPDVRSISQTTAPVRPKNQPNSQTAFISKSQQRNQAVLDLAKKSLRLTQASDLRMAILTARKIKAGEPLYDQAQENIKIWSQMILDLAEGRAKQKQYSSAIKAAALITKSEPFYPKAQAAINQWRLEAKQYVSNTTVLDAANGLIQPGQASTYNRAIEVAKKVSPGQPGFDEAQKSMNKWSQIILSLAKRRAAKGEFKTAIETALLVPEVTAPYEEAQTAIQKWRKK
ncbi:peptidase C14 caspase catalytic subunit p20 [Tolypothrix sp. NIES-4075]|uniref:caspase family protein n=1 Tax=Tolypothrix sp. NIES-4075 TaxID=2005459 RepID=UPI000B5CD7D7|nr:caspase family protein [Tolypothrix sp. NIES-4075]GAX44816.1 peptidase C14 caspase catalytic subunit p20 [Tolypothrix sp. NIES-4075]